MGYNEGHIGVVGKGLDMDRLKKMAVILSEPQLMTFWGRRADLVHHFRPEPIVGKNNILSGMSADVIAIDEAKPLLTKKSIEDLPGSLQNKIKLHMEKYCKRMSARQTERYMKKKFNIIINLR